MRGRTLAGPCRTEKCKIGRKTATKRGEKPRDSEKIRKNIPGKSDKIQKMQKSQRKRKKRGRRKIKQYWAEKIKNRLKISKTVREGKGQKKTEKAEKPCKTQSIN